MCSFWCWSSEEIPQQNDIYNNQNNPLPLKTHDAINVVDISLLGNDESLEVDHSLELDTDVDRDRFNV